MHGDDVAAVTDKARASSTRPCATRTPPADTLAYARAPRHRCSSSAAAWPARRPPPSSPRWAIRSSSSSAGPSSAAAPPASAPSSPPTTAASACPPATPRPARASASTATSPSTTPTCTIRRRATVESVTGHPGDFEVERAPPAQHRHRRLHQLRHLRDGLRGRSAEPGKKAIYTEFYDGRVVRTVDLDTCTFCGKCAEECPVDAIDFTQSPERVNDPRRRHPHRRRLRAGAAPSTTPSSTRTTATSSPRSSSPRCSTTGRSRPRWAACRSRNW